MHRHESGHTNPIPVDTTLSILHVITDLEVGGAETALVGLATTGQGSHKTLAVAALMGDGHNRTRLEEAGIAVYDLGMRRGRPDPRAAARLARLIRTARPALVQGWMYHADLLALAALVLSRRRSVTRLVWSLRCSDMDAAQYGPLFAVVRRAWIALSGRVDAVIANSDAGVAAHRAMGWRPRALFRVDNGVDPQTFRPDAQTRAETRRMLGLSDGEVVAAIVGRVDPMKDHTLFLRVLDQVAGVRAVAVGLGTEALAGRPNLLRLGRRDDVPRLLAASDLLLATSRFGEGFPNVVVEAMSSGIPVVATDVGDTRRIIGETGVVVPPGDDAALAAAVRFLAADGVRRRDLGLAARRRVEENFTLARMRDRFAAAHAAILHRRTIGAAEVAQ